MKKFTYLSASNVSKGEFHKATGIYHMGDVVVIYSNDDLIGVVKLAPGENISLITDYKESQP